MTRKKRKPVDVVKDRSKRYRFIGPNNPTMPVFWPSEGPCECCDPKDCLRYEEMKIFRSVILSVCPGCAPELWEELI